VNLKGADLNELSQRRAKDGAVEGDAVISGVFRAGTVNVTGQSLVSPPHNTPYPDDDPPCAAPRGGWPRGLVGENIDLSAAFGYRRVHPGAFAQIAELRPSATQVLVMLETNGNPAPVRTALLRAYGKRLCVVKSRYTTKQIDAASAHMSELVTSSHGFAWMGGGTGMTRHGQVLVPLQLEYVTPDVAHRVSLEAPGLVDVDPWLIPQREAH
jgi:hypothetical protein